MSKVKVPTNMQHLHDVDSCQYDCKKIAFCFLTFTLVMVWRSAMNSTHSFKCCFIHSAAFVEIRLCEYGLYVMLENSSTMLTGPRVPPESIHTNWSKTYYNGIQPYHLRNMIQIEKQLSYIGKNQILTNSTRGYYCIVQYPKLLTWTRRSKFSSGSTILNFKACTSSNMILLER